jgi:signal transduction histidine kinase/HPt (histidine-containing phosphotransfer) domain-containing protein
MSDFLTKADDSEDEHVRDAAILRGRVALLFALSQHYLFLPFAALCMAAALVHQTALVWVVSTPLILQIAATVAANRLKRAYDARGPEEDDPLPWAKRYTVLSGFVGAIWGLGAIIWFVPNSFPAEAYLVLAYLGMTATEFVVRAAYRPAYLAHAVASLGPLTALLLFDGGFYQMFTAILVMFFGGVLYSYSGNFAKLLDESILLRHDNARLIVRLSEEKRAAELARDSAQSSERAKSVFISNISHEIRTPLNAILGMAQLLERSDLEKAQRDHVRVLLESGLGLKTLLDDVIALAQQDGNIREPEEGCDALRAARTVVRLLQPNAWEKRLRLSVNADANLPRALIDPRQLRRVMLKLAGNAIKFTERGSVEIALDSITGKDGQPCLRCRVIDTGPGIPTSMLSTLFNPFAKGDMSYARRHNGAGVGLAVAKQLIESAQGEIGAEGTPGLGAMFWFTLPALRAPVEPIGQSNAAPPGNLSILCYTPDPRMRTSLEQWLAPFGNRLTFANSLAEAATLSMRGSFSLLISTQEGVDSLAAMPGQRTPILAIMGIGERMPSGAQAAIRWPAAAAAIYAAIAEITGNGVVDRADSEAAAIEAAIDAKAFAALEKSLGLKTLIDILQSYLGTTEDLTMALTKAVDQDDWTEAGRLAQDIAGAAGGLGLSALTSAARTLAQNARDGASAPMLTQASGEVLAQHSRVREALRRLYPDAAA